MFADASAQQHQKTADCTSTGPGAVAGRYLRQFWQPIYHSADLAVGRPVPLRIMSEDFTLYRGESGQVHLVDARCPHRGTQLSSGWVEGEGLRCFYHGWKFDGGGQCVEQPAEDSSYCDRVKLAARPIREYLGLVFAFLGEGAPPEFPLFREFDAFAGVIEVDSYYRECNYFQNVENALDMSHVGFVHRDNMVAYNGIGRGAQLRSEESDWGVVYTFTRADGHLRVQQFGMPNIFYMTALPTDPEIGWQESLFWWVPIDDLHHIQFSLHRIPVDGETAARVKARHQDRRAKIDLPHQRLCAQILRGRLSLRDVDKSRVDLVRLQDDIAQVGQGRIADRDRERPGRADTGVIAIRRLWNRELAAVLGGGTLKRWKRDAKIVPRAWGLGGAAGAAERETQTDAVPDITDIRPQVEIDIQLDALHGLGDTGTAVAADPQPVTSGMAIIEVVGVSKTYEDPTTGRKTRTLDNISLSAKENDFLILLGPSGCGKSTLLNIIAGLVPHDADGGEVRVEGKPVTGPNPKLMAYMFQDPVLYPWRTVLRNVEFGLEALGIAKAARRERAFKYLRMVGLEDFADYYPRQLSGGMAQRVAICRSLALETDIILMDEPFGALDEQSRIILGDELIEIWRKVRRTVVFVTHSLTEAAYLGERIAVFSARPGRIKVEVENRLPRPRRLGKPEFSRMVDTLWSNLKDESLIAIKRAPAEEERLELPQE